VRDGLVVVIYVMYGESDDSSLAEEVRVALRNSRRRFVWPLTEDTDFSLGADPAQPLRRHKRVDEFWVRLRLAIPFRRKVLRATEKAPLLVWKAQLPLLPAGMHDSEQFYAVHLWLVRACD